MAVVREFQIGNAKVFVCDDAYRDVSPEEMSQRKTKVREIMAQIAAAPGAAERLAAYRATQQEMNTRA